MVWREENGELAWDVMQYHWVAERPIEEVHAWLIARGCTGTRTDERSPQWHLVLFQQGTERLAFYAARRSHRGGLPGNKGGAPANVTRSK